MNGPPKNHFKNHLKTQKSHEWSKVQWTNGTNRKLVVINPNILVIMLNINGFDTPSKLYG